jgi:hypothetical protein
MKNKIIKLSWKGRLIFGFVSGIVFFCVVFVLDLIFVDNTHSFNYYIIQGIAFGIFIGIGMPYVSEKFKSRFIRPNKKSQDT